MATAHASNDEFFAGLAKLFASRAGRTTGSIHLTQKPFLFDSAAPPKHDALADVAPRPQPIPLLVRVSDGRSKEARKKAPKTKLSTVVQPADVDAFFVRYAEVCRAGMTSLKKRDRSGRKKAKKKKGGAAVGAASGGGGASGDKTA